MKWPMGRTAKRIGGILAGLGLMAPALFSAQIFTYRKAAPDKGHLIRTVPFEKWLRRNYCGPACLAMVLNAWDETRPFSQQKIADEVYVVIGFDEDEDQNIFHDPLFGDRQAMRTQAFMKVWELRTGTIR